MQEKIKFDNYVSYWTRVAKDTSALDVSRESVNSNEWIALAEAQYNLLKSAGLKKNWIILEIGCGNGKIPYMLNREKAIPNGRYYGLDIIEESIATCLKRFNNKNFYFDLIKNNQLNFKDAFADCIFLASVFTHVDENTIKSYLKQIHRILKQQGVCIFSVHLIPSDSLMRMTIQISQYSFRHIKELVTALGFFTYQFSSYPQPDSEAYLPGVLKDRPYGHQYYFIITKIESSNPELAPL